MGTALVLSVGQLVAYSVYVLPHPRASRSIEPARDGGRGRELYDLGQDITLCWETPAGGSPVRADCEGAFMEFTSELSDTLYSDQFYTIDFKMHVPLDQIGPSRRVWHANLHTCLRNLVFCSPFIANNSNLATHEVELSGVLDDGGNLSFTQRIRNEAGSYTVIAHGAWYKRDGTTLDISRARITDVMVSAESDPRRPHERKQPQRV